MKRSRLALLAGALWLLPAGMAAAQPTPITSCYTTITQSGSYVLTHDLNCVPTSGDGITIATSATHVTLDLDGFALAGNAQFHSAINNGALYVAVSNGTIKGWGYGISGGTQYVLSLRNVTIASSQRAAVGGGAFASFTVANCRFIQNSGGSLDGGPGAFLVRDSIFSGDLGGVNLNAPAILANNLAWAGAVFQSGAPAIYVSNGAADSGSGFLPTCPGSVMTYNQSNSPTSYPAGCVLRDNVP